MNCWETCNTSFHGSIISDTVHVRLHCLKERVTKAYNKDKDHGTLEHRSLSTIPLQTRLHQRVIQIQNKWLDNVHVAKKTYTLITVTNQIKLSYIFGQTKIASSYNSFFNTPLREQLNINIHEQIKWISKYNTSVTSSTTTLHHYFHPPGRPPGRLAHSELIH